MNTGKLNNISGNRLKECIKEKGITQTKLAESIFVSPQYISYLVNGKKPLPQRTALDIAEKLGVSADYLLGKSSRKEREISVQEWDKKFKTHNETLLSLLSFYGIKILRQVIITREENVIYNYNIRSFFSASRTEECEQMVIKDNEYRSIEYDIELSDKVYRVPSHRINEIILFLNTFLKMKKYDFCNSAERNEYKEIEYVEDKSKKVPATFGCFFE